MLQKKPCCPAEAVRMVKLLTLPDGIQVGILNLDTILKQVADLKLTDIQAVKKALLERVKADNYISSRAEDRYAEALFQEYQKYIMAQIER